MNVNVLWGGYEWLRVKKNVRKEFEKIKDTRFREIADSNPHTNEQKETIDDFFLINCGEKIPYVWHQYFTAHSGLFNLHYFLVDKDGIPALMECNIFNGTIYAIQVTRGVPAFGDHTAEVLQWIRKMKHTSYSKRGDYAFGY